MNKNNIKLDFDKSKKLKNSVLYKKINLNLNINKSNTFMSNNSTSPNNNNKIKLNKFFNFKESKSNNIILPSKKNKEIIMTDISNPKSKNENFKNFFFKKDNNDIDEHSYAFQKLVNLNKDKSMNEALNINNNFFNEINLKKKKTLEKSPDKEKFFLRDSKKYFNDDNNRKYSEYIKSNLKLNEQPNYKKIGHRSIKFGQNVKNNKEFLEYDGDKDSETLRKNNISNKKDINKINEQKNEKIKDIIIP